MIKSFYECSVTLSLINSGFVFFVFNSLFFELLLALFEMFFARFVNVIHIKNRLKIYHSVPFETQRPLSLRIVTTSKNWWVLKIQRTSYTSISETSKALKESNYKKLTFAFGSRSRWKYWDWKNLAQKSRSDISVGQTSRNFALTSG